jgi:hypothetical protein
MALRPPQRDYRPEFKELGADKVRSELLLRRWDAEKLAAARLWVENADAHNWVAGRGDAAPRVKPQWFRKWAMYAIMGFGVSYAVVRIVRTLHWGG